MNKTKFVYALHRDCSPLEQATIVSSFGEDGCKFNESLHSVDLLFDDEKSAAVEKFWDMVCRTRALIDRTFLGRDGASIAFRDMVSAVVQDVELYCLIDNFKRDSDMRKLKGFLNVIDWIHETMENREGYLIDGMESGVAYCFWVQPRLPNTKWIIVWIRNNGGVFECGSGSIKDGKKRWWHDSPEKISTALALYNREGTATVTFPKTVVLDLAYVEKDSSLITLVDCVKQAIKKAEAN